MSESVSAKQQAAPTPRASHTFFAFISRHGAPFVLAGLLWYVLWWGHSPDLKTPEEAKRHVSWVGLGALIYLALQIRAVLALPRGSVLHPIIEVMVSLLPLLVVLYAGLDWIRGSRPLSVFQVIVMQQAGVAVLIDVVFFTFVSMRLAQHSVPIALERS